MVAVRKAHFALGEGLGLDEDSEAEAPAVGERVAALAEAIADYGRVLGGRVKKHDPASRARFITAMAPLDAHRARYRRGSTTSADADEPAELPDELPDEDDELDID
ncbi:hypothetical protein, partial [Enhygromyxa salina]|uniref:hypothetical protein n=1 Tax=Enhygromyxa salina TaxID=215803 RepID=UPI0011B1FE03